MILKRLITNKCPNCGKGNLFKKGGFYNKTSMEMNHKCSDCNMDFIREPGFYTGAMYVSYALDLFLGCILFSMFQLLQIELSSWIFIGSFSILLLVLFPQVFRYSRGIWLWMFTF